MQNRNITRSHSSSLFESVGFLLCVAFTAAIIVIQIVSICECVTRINDDINTGGRIVIALLSDSCSLSLSFVFFCLLALSLSIALSLDAMLLMNCIFGSWRYSYIDKIKTVYVYQYNCSECDWQVCAKLCYLIFIWENTWAEFCSFIIHTTTNTHFTLNCNSPLTSSPRLIRHFFLCSSVFIRLLDLLAICGFDVYSNRVCMSTLQRFRQKQHTIVNSNGQRSQIKTSYISSDSSSCSSIGFGNDHIYICNCILLIITSPSEIIYISMHTINLNFESSVLCNRLLDSS